MDEHAHQSKIKILFWLGFDTKRVLVADMLFIDRETGVGAGFAASLMYGVRMPVSVVVVVVVVVAMAMTISVVVF